MFRFSIRELMLVTLVAAVCVAWRVDHHGQFSSAVRENVDLQWKVVALEDSLRMMHCEFRYDEFGLHMTHKWDPHRQDLIYSHGARPTEWELWTATSE